MASPLAPTEETACEITKPSRMSVWQQSHFCWCRCGRHQPHRTRKDASCLTTPLSPPGPRGSPWPGVARRGRARRTPPSVCRPAPAADQQAAAEVLVLERLGIDDPDAPARRQQAEQVDDAVADRAGVRFRDEGCEDGSWADAGSTVTRLLARTFASEEVRAIEDRRRQGRRLTTSKLLPEVLALKNGGLLQREVAERLGLTKRQVEHVLRRWREHVAGWGYATARPSAAFQCLGRCDPNRAIPLCSINPIGERRPSRQVPPSVPVLRPDAQAAAEAGSGGMIQPMCAVLP
jgi:hypothetical protein